MIGAHPSDALVDKYLWRRVSLLCRGYNRNSTEDKNVDCRNIVEKIGRKVQQLFFQLFIVRFLESGASPLGGADGAEGIFGFAGHVWAAAQRQNPL